MSKYNICVVCGAGFATSKLIADQLKTLLNERNIDTNIIVTRVSDLSNVSNYDLIVTATLLSDSYDVPVVRTMSFLTGISMDKDVDMIVDVLQNKNNI